MSPLRFIIPSSTRMMHAARFKNHNKKLLEPKKALKSKSPGPISWDSPNTTSPSGINDSPKNRMIAKEHDTKADLEDIIFFIVSPLCETHDRRISNPFRWEKFNADNTVLLLFFRRIILLHI